MLDNWQRIEQLQKWAGMASVSALAREIGLNRSENLYQIKRGNNGISKDLAESVTRRFPEISKAWLLTGEGDMLPGKGSHEKYDIPFFKTDAADLLRLGEKPEPDYYISLPMYRGCEFAAFSLSDAMAPEIKRGSTLLFESRRTDAVTPGEIYLVVSPRFTGVRNLRKNPDSPKVRLIPCNKAEYDEVVIEMAEIEKLYVVRGILSNR